MKRTLVVLALATTFLLCLAAVREHTALVRKGYEVAALEKQRENLRMEEARARERLVRMSAPAVLAERARDLGLSEEYPREFAVVKVVRSGAEAPLLVRNE